MTQFSTERPLYVHTLLVSTKSVGMSKISRNSRNASEFKPCNTITIFIKSKLVRKSWFVCQLAVGEMRRWESTAGIVSILLKRFPIIPVLIWIEMYIF